MQQNEISEKIYKLNAEIKEAIEDENIVKLKVLFWDKFQLMMKLEYALTSLSFDIISNLEDKENVYVNLSAYFDLVVNKECNETLGDLYNFFQTSFPPHEINKDLIDADIAEIFTEINKDTAKYIDIVINKFYL